MLLAVITSRPIYKAFLTHTTVTEQQDALATNAGFANIVLKQIPNSNDSIRTIAVQRKLESGLQYKLQIVDTVFDGDVSKKSVQKISFIEKTLPSNTYWLFIALVFVQILYVTMVYGPIAAFLVELFPTKIRYTSMSLPYHIGNGVFGGLVPFVATLITTFNGADALSGLWYPIGVAAICFVIGAIYLSNKKQGEN
jgi:hypothetical protein